jgi:hypothetical protein
LLASIPEPPFFPARRELDSSLGRREHLLDVAIARGLHALGWLVDSAASAAAASSMAWPGP